MLYVSRWKTIAVVLTCLGALLLAAQLLLEGDRAKLARLAAETAVAARPRPERGRAPAARHGHERVRKDWLDNVRDDARRRLREAKIAFSGPGVANNVVQVRLAEARRRRRRSSRRCKDSVHSRPGNLILGTTVTDLEVKKGEAGLITIAPTEAGVQDALPNAVSASIETVRRRVDQLGTAEATVVRQGRDRVLVQFPGIQDTTRLNPYRQDCPSDVSRGSPTLSAEEPRQRAFLPATEFIPSSGGEDGRSLARDAGGARR